MSWISENYEKAAIGGAAVVALALAALIFKNKDAVEEAAVLTPVKPDNDVTVVELPKIKAAQSSLAEEHVITHYDQDGRKVNLFTGVPLFAKTSCA